MKIDKDRAKVRSFERGSRGSWSSATLALPVFRLFFEWILVMWHCLRDLKINLASLAVLMFLECTRRVSQGFLLLGGDWWWVRGRRGRRYGYGVER